MANESTKKTLLVAVAVCLVCSILVSTAAVMLEAAGLWEPGTDAEEIYNARIRTAVVDLSSGNVLEAHQYEQILDPEDFDIESAAKHPVYSRMLPQDRDFARIQRIPNHMVIYLVKEKEETIRFILPIYGMGLWSRMYGFIALNRDLHTIEGFTFYKHAETPGLGGEIDNPRWKQIWVGKQAFDSEGKLRIHVQKNAVDASDPDAVYRIDGLSGSTLTTRGVDRTVRFWLGDDGYGRFIRQLGEEG